MIAVFMCVCGGFFIADRCAVAKDRYDRMVEEAGPEGLASIEREAA